MAGSQGGRFNGINSERSEEFSEGELYPHDMRIEKERGPAGIAVKGTAPAAQGKAGGACRDENQIETPAL